MKLGQQALEIRRQASGAESLPVALALRQLGTSLFAKGDYAEAEGLLRQALEIERKKGPADDLELATTLKDLATAVGQGRGDPAGAEALLREALAIRMARHGPEHPETTQVLNDLAVVRLQQEDYEEAEKLYEQALAAQKRVDRRGPSGDGSHSREPRRRLFPHRAHRREPGRPGRGAGHPPEGPGRGQPAGGSDAPEHRASSRRRPVDYREAEASFEQALPRMRAVQGPEHPEIAQVLSNWGRLKKAEKDYPAAEGLYRQSLDLRLRKLGEEHPDVATVRFDLGSLLALVRRYAEAEPLLVKARDSREKRLGKDAAPTHAAAEELAKVRAARADAKSAE